MFKNLTVFRLETTWFMSPEELRGALAAHPLRDCGALESETTGWLPMADSDLVLTVEKHLLISYGIRTKILPASVIKEEVAQRAVAFEAARGFKPSRRVLRDLKEAVTVELLPQALSRLRVVQAWIDPAAGTIAVDASSMSLAETVIEGLREALGELPVRPWVAETSPARTMSAWLAEGEPPEAFAINTQCELAGNDAARKRISYHNTELKTAEIRAHLNGGMRCSRLGLVWLNRMSIVLNEQLQLLRLAQLDFDASLADDDSDADRLAADAALFCGNASELIADLTIAMGAPA